MNYLAAGYLSVAALTNIPVLYPLWVDWRQRRTTRSPRSRRGFFFWTRDMTKAQYIPTTIKFRGYFAESREDGRWTLRGRGQRSIVTHEELLGKLNSRPKKARK